MKDYFLSALHNEIIYSNLENQLNGVIRKIEEKGGRIYLINKNNKDNYIELSGEYKILSYTIDVKDEIQEIRKEEQKRKLKN